MLRQSISRMTMDPSTGAPPPYYTSENYTPVRNVGRVVQDVASEMQATLSRETAALGITGPQWVVLMRISSGIRASAADLCRNMGYDSGSMTRMLDRLEKLGLIERHRSLEDRRVINLSLTPAGQALRPQLTPIAIKVLDRFLHGFTVAEEETLTNLLERMLANGERP